jgi:hypothetical protein
MASVYHNPTGSWIIKKAVDGYQGRVLRESPQVVSAAKARINDDAIHSVIGHGVKDASFQFYVPIRVA